MDNFDEYTFENYEILENGIPQNKRPPRTYQLWQLLIMLITVFLIMILASLIMCVSTKECRISIPTIHVMLTSPKTAPYMVVGLTSGLYVFFITCIALYVKTDNKFVLIGGLGVYASIAAILIVFPFTGWDENWAILLFIGAYLTWMIVIALALRKTYAERLKALQIVTIVIYAGCGIVYAVLKFVPVINKQIGVLVVDVIGTFAIIGYMSICLALVWNVKVTISPK